MTPEKKVKNKVAILKEHKAYYFYPMTGGYGMVFDIVGCYRGIFFGIEWCETNLLFAKQELI